MSFRPFDRLAIHPRLIQIQRPLQFLIVVVISILVISGIVQLLQWQFPFRFPGRFMDVELTLQASATTTPGRYRLTGAANLPNDTQLNVAAVRYLYSTNAASIALNPDPTYSILDYQTVSIRDRQWQAELDLWQVDVAGQYREAWQLVPGMELSLRPDEDVVFVATLAPIEQLAQFEQQLARQQLRLQSGTVRSDATGQRYAQTNQVLAVGLPSGQTTPAPPPPEWTNYGWGYRYLIPVEPQNPYKLERPDNRITDAPRSPQEFLH